MCKCVVQIVKDDPNPKKHFYSLVIFIVSRFCFLCFEPCGSDLKFTVQHQLPQRKNKPISDYTTGWKIWPKHTYVIGLWQWKKTHLSSGSVKALLHGNVNGAQKTCTSQRLLDAKLYPASSILHAQPKTALTNMKTNIWNIMIHVITHNNLMQKGSGAYATIFKYVDCT